MKCSNWLTSTANLRTRCASVSTFPVRHRLRSLRVTQATCCRICLTSLGWRSEVVHTRMHPVDLRYEQEELLALFDLASQEDVDEGGRYDRRGGAIIIWSHHWGLVASVAERSYALRF